MYPSDFGSKFLIQYTVTGTATLNGADYGRPRLTINPVAGTDGIVYIAAKNYGAAANAITVQYIDAGAGVVVPVCQIQQLGPAITVLLARSAIAITATAPQVAAALNSFTGYTSPAYAIRAKANNPAATIPLAATSAQLLTGGVDPLVVPPSQYLWAPPLNTSAGLVTLDNSHPMWVLGFAVKFPAVGVGTFSVKVSRVRLDEVFRPIMAEAVPIFVHDRITTAAPDIAYTDVRQVVHPSQGLLVEATVPAPGFFNFDVTRAADFPYA